MLSLGKEGVTISSLAIQLFDDLQQDMDTKNKVLINFYRFTHKMAFSL